ncbi:MAG: hypothetical protein LBB25_02555 [Holosporaceae bacterium]|jgi:hypothetical protein|nr:hypothetical protein [Holosporaceae bacterium]
MLPDNNRGFNNMFEAIPRPDMLGKSDASLNAPIGGSKTPQYTIETGSDDDIFSSDMNGDFAKAAPVLWIETGGARLATYDSSGQLSGDGKIVCRDPILCMKYGDWSPALQQYMFEGKKITTIIVKRVISVSGTLVVIQEITYGTCLIKTYMQSGDTITFSFCYVTITDLSKAYDHQGTLIGNVGVTYDSASVTVESAGS